jgi:glycine hydroxymethyltransferase
MVPFDDKSPFITSGIRIGTPAITTRGVELETIPTIVNLIDAALSHDEESSEFAQIKSKVNELMTPYPLFKEA